MITPTMRFHLLLSIIYSGTLALASPARRETDAGQNTCDHEDCASFGERLAKGIDWETDPCDDFYQFACGSWIESTKNPEKDILYDDSTIQLNTQRDQIREILQSPNSESEVALNKAKIMYNSCLNLESDINDNVNDLKQHIDQLGGWKLGTTKTVEKADVINLIIQVASSSEISVPFSLIAEIDYKNLSFQYPRIDQPEEKNLLTTLYPDLSPRDIATLATTMFDVSDEAKAEQDSQDVLQFDRILKKMIRNKGGLKRIQINYPKVNEEVDLLTLLNAIFSGLKTFSPDERMKLKSIQYLRKFFSLINDPNNARTAYNYIMLYETMKIVRPIGNFLPSPLNEIGSFVGSVYGPSCLESVQKCFDLAIARKLGELYHDIGKETEMIKEMMENILGQFSNRLNQLDWLDETSRNEAQKKIKYLNPFYEYPRWVTDLEKANDYYKDIKSTETFVEGNLQCIRHSRRVSLETIIQPPRGHITWSSSVLEVNAYYAAYKNDLHILEAILEDPMFNIHRLRAMNYGGIGGVLGHELIHGFDDVGVQYDEIGRYRPWLSKESQEQFKERTQCLIDQYSDFILTDLPGPTTEFQVDGELTLGENIADDGGLKMSYFAYQQWQKDNGPEILPDSLNKHFTTDQTFFLSYARSWCEKYEHGIAKDDLEDTHSPNKFRVNGPVSNFDKFGEAFNCPAGSPMARGEEACSIW